MSTNNGSGHVYTEDELRHNYLKRTEAQRRAEDERQRESGAVGSKVAAALGYANEGEMSIRVAEVAIERRKRKPTTMASDGPIPHRKISKVETDGDTIHITYENND